MKISRQWQLRPGPRHLHHNNMQATVARMGRGGGINRILGILSYYFCPCAKLVGAQQERGREREHEWSITLQYYHSTTESNLSVRCFGKFLEIGLLISVRHQSSLCRGLVLVSVYPLILCHWGLLLLEISFICQDQDFMKRKYRIYKILALL